jgi:hypothetical protein
MKWERKWPMANGVGQIAEVRRGDQRIENK